MATRGNNSKSALIGKLQEFLLELGAGFCFEARQKRTLIGDTYGFVDLVFYHRTLVEYALAGIDNQLFVSKYQLALPDKEQMQEFMEREIAQIELKGDTTEKGMLLREMQATYKYEL